MLRAAGQGRGRPRGALRSQGRAGSGGIVVQAVLLTVMVMTIGLLAVISRVAGSRDASSASSLQAAARQAAEFGFSEIVAEMNRDSKSYLWVTPFGSWGSVSQANLSACGIFAASAPAATPIAGVSSSQALPDSPELSYQLTGFQPPTIIDSSGSCGVFGNRKGGTATLTIIGRLQRSSGDATTYTLRRLVSVGPISPFQQSLLVESGSPTADFSKFSDFPPSTATPPTSPPATIDLTCTASSASSYRCTHTDGTVYDFSNSVQLKFPYKNDGTLADFCSDAGASAPINCGLASLAVGASVDLIVTATAAKPVNLFIDGTLSVATNAKLCSHASSGSASDASVTTCTAAIGDWQQLRIYGVAGGSGRTCPSQTVQLNAMTTPTADSGKPNLQGAFLWFPVGSLTVGGTITASQADLRGWVCQRPTPLAGASGLRIWPDAILGAPTAYIFRGYGSRDLPPS